MLNAKLINTTTGESSPVTIPSNWGEVTLEQFAKVQGKTPLEQAAVFCGLTMEQMHLVSLDSIELIIAALEFVRVTSPVMEDQAWHKNITNIGMESVGQLELVKAFMKANNTDNIWDMAPYLIAVYAWPDEYDITVAFTTHFPTALITRAKALPITEAIAFVVFFSANSKGCRQLLKPFLSGSPTWMQSQPMLSGSKSSDSLDRQSLNQMAIRGN